FVESNALFEPSPGEFTEDVLSGAFDNSINELISQGFSDRDIFNHLVFSGVAVAGLLSYSQRQSIYNYIAEARRRFINAYVDLTDRSRSDPLIEFGNSIGLVGLGIMGVGALAAGGVFLAGAAGAGALLSLFLATGGLVGTFGSGLSLTGLTLGWFESDNDLSRQKYWEEHKWDYILNTAGLILDLGAISSTFDDIFKNLDDLGRAWKLVDVVADSADNIATSTDDTIKQIDNVLVSKTDDVADNIDNVVDAVDDFAKKVSESNADISLASADDAFKSRHILDAKLVDKIDNVLNTFKETKGIDLSNVDIILTDNTVTKGIQNTVAFFDPDINKLVINLDQFEKLSETDQIITLFHEYAHSLKITNHVKALNGVPLKNWEDFKFYAKSVLGIEDSTAINSLYDTCVHKYLIDMSQEGKITQFTLREYVDSVVHRYNFVSNTLFDIADGTLDAKNVIFSKDELSFISELNVLSQNTNNLEVSIKIQNAMKKLNTNINYDTIIDLSGQMNKAAWMGSSWK
ncbi:MAG: hypothetical protein JW791_02250, partial [Nanoarchaeota archaeon]|nr:hypothetical protein [Nanoarchaeota archaeon]